MKKLLVLALAGAMTLTIMVGCSSAQGQDANNPSSEHLSSGVSSVAIFRGTIEEINDNQAIVTPNDDQEHILSSGDKVSVNLNSSDDKFTVGNEVVVYYTGEIMESYPLQINTVDIEFAEDFDKTTNENDNISNAMIAINIEGVVSDIDGNRITLDSGKVVIITDDTAFEALNVGETVTVGDEIKVGNFIQGFTSGDADANEVTADFINTNQAPQISASAIVNIEGVITEVSEDGKSFLLDAGKWVTVNAETEIGITGPNAAPEGEQLFEDTFRVGNSIAGFTEDENADELVAYAIYTNWNFENPVK